MARKVKSGCRTCKIRKVKCDEGRPACHRCLSTGRECEGYGVWGGGGNFYGDRQYSIVSRRRSVAPWLPACVSILADSTEEKQNFEWFQYRTAKKIPGAFVLTFWDTLLFQASMDEPAVLHAVLTLSSVHRNLKESFKIHGPSRSSNIPNKQEQFMLQQYIKAIRHLQPHFSTKDRASVRVALITCVVFVCLEFLRGHFQTAQTHLQNGLKVLRELQITSSADDGALFLKPFRNPIDDWIVEAFSRQLVQVELFKQTHQHPCSVLLRYGPSSSVSAFFSINEAWQQIERLLNEVFCLTNQARQLHTSSNSLDYHVLLEHQQQIQAELAQWLGTYESSKTTLQTQDPSGLACHLLCEYRTMASIMASTCLSPNSQSIFDTHTSQFISILNHSIIMWKIGTSSQSQVLLDFKDMPRSLVDIGWIAPLYYTAIKCRVHRIRVQAVRLLESASHREGIWDSRIAAGVARKVAEIEEGDFYKDVDTADDFLLSTSPGLRDLSLSVLPQSYRIHEIEVILSNGLEDSVSLLYKLEQTGGDWKKIQVFV